jgi:hypothetical protein
VSDEEPETESECDSDDEEPRAPQTALSEDDVKTKITELKDAKKAARRHIGELKQSIEDLSAPAQASEGVHCCNQSGDQPHMYCGSQQLLQACDPTRL